MTRRRLFTMGAVVLGTLAIPATTARAATDPHTPACTDSWKAAVSGVWSVGANWSDGQIPTGNDNVCITVPGIYTVTLAPWSIGTADPNNDGANVHSITIGATGGTGTQTLDIAGQGSTSNSNEQVSTVFLNVAATSTISAHGSLILDSTDGGSTLPDNPSGGYAAVLGANVQNYGSVETEVQDLKNKYANFTQFEASLTNETGASVHDSSGLLEATAVTNKGRFTVATRASLSVVALQGVFGAPASFTNAGELVNNGSITANQVAGTVTWTQSAGSIKGNEVTLQGGATLVDAVGAGQFLMNSIAAKLTGTIPIGQKITVVGEAYNSAGDNYNGTSLVLDGHTVVNHGTLVLEAQGSGNKTGGPAVVTDGSIRNDGTILAEVHDPSWTVQYQAGLQNTRAGIVTVNGGTFDDEGGGTVANDGTVKIGPRAAYLLEGATAFSNKGGAIEPQIASSTSLGQFVLVSGKFTAGGALLPGLVGTKPAANTEFRLFVLSGGTFAGTFAHVGSPFTADYGHESASPAFVGAIYDKSAKKKKG